ncbi:MAG: carboxypeptidase-like regulatory domain-containing protein, partial [Vulcanimicrobiaceae bacterium]
MKTKLGLWRIVAAMLALAFAGTGLMVPQPAFAGTTGTILGTVTDASTHAPIADVKVTASSPSGNYSTTTDAKGFYSLQSLIPDTYTVSFQANGYEPVSSPGITAQQDLPVTINETLSRTLKTIASVRASGSSNLVKSNVTTDVYTVSGQQLTAISGGDNLHKTLYQYMQALPGVTADGYPSQPRIRGGQVTDLGYEFDGIPIQDRITGFFTTNLSSVGISNVEVYTGGLTAENAANGTGVINSVVKTGTYPSFGDVSFGVTSPDQNNYTTLEYGGMTPNRKFSYYLSG